jgi:hypothetical protein
MKACEEHHISLAVKHVMYFIWTVNNKGVSRIFDAVYDPDEPIHSMYRKEKEGKIANNPVRWFAELNVLNQKKLMKFAFDCYHEEQIEETYKRR